MYRLLTDSPVGKVGNNDGGRNLWRGDGLGATIAERWCNDSAELPMASRRAAEGGSQLSGCIVIVGGAGGAGFLTAAANRVLPGSLYARLSRP
jgi:hypothetical protein